MNNSSFNDTFRVMFGRCLLLLFPMWKRRRRRRRRRRVKWSSSSDCLWDWCCCFGGSCCFFFFFLFLLSGLWPMGNDGYIQTYNEHGWRLRRTHTQTLVSPSRVSDYNNSPPLSTLILLLFYLHTIRHALSDRREKKIKIENHRIEFEGKETKQKQNKIQLSIRFNRIKISI